jgi:hypothetical protein
LKKRNKKLLLFIRDSIRAWRGLATFGRRPEILVDITNRQGSVEHYYHFILGFLAPLVLHMNTGPRPATRIIRSCGPMDCHLAPFALPNLRIVPKQRWLELRDAGHLETEQLGGFDEPIHFDVEAFQRFRRIVLQRFGQFEAATSAPGPVLVINRGKSLPFYQTEHAEVQTSAGLRRSVPNMAALLAAATAQGVKTRVVELEEWKLRAQVALFAGTRILVAQHGAALVNMLWMAPGGVIVEINPVAEGLHFQHWFRRLATASGHDYVSVSQGGVHAPVDETEFCEALRTAQSLYRKKATRTEGKK